MPNPMPLLCLAALTSTLMLPALASAEDRLDSASQRLSLGLRLNTTTLRTGLGGLGGAGGLGGLLGPSYGFGDAITVGIPLGESGWRFEPGLAASYSSNENVSSSSVNLGIMPQRVIASNAYGLFYAGALFEFSRLRYTFINQANDAESSTTFASLGVQPVIGVQGMLGDSLGIGFEVGPALVYTPASDSENVLGELTTLDTTSISTNMSLTLKYYF